MKRHGEAALIFNVWCRTGQDPYQLYNELTPDYRPMHDPSLPPRPPKFPERVRLFVYACGARWFQMQEERIRRSAQMTARALAG